MSRAVVFAYHKVGVRCLKVLLAQQIDVALVVTHRDAADENIWFDSVAVTAVEYGVPFATPDDANTAETIDKVRAIAPDFIFSFYYRNLLGPPLLAIASRGEMPK